MSARIAERREAMGLSQTELAERMGVTPQAVQQWERERGTSPRGKRLDLLVKTLQTTKGYLFGETDNVSDPIKTRPTVPLIDWIAAGDWGNQQPEAREQFRSVMNVFDTGANGYALVVSGESMLPRYQPKDIIFVNPDMVAEVGRRVIAVCSTGTTFKELATDDNGALVLKALNVDWKPRYIPLEDDCYIVGVVVGSVRPE